MKSIEGFVCTVKSKMPVVQERLYGPNLEASEQAYQNFCTNNLTPFCNSDEAFVACEKMKDQNNFEFIRYGIASVRMQIASSEEEFELFYRKKGLIIIIESEMKTLTLLGRRVDGAVGIAYAPVSNLEFNGFKTFRRMPESVLKETFLEGFHPLEEVRRQGRPISSTLATFSLKRHC